MTGRGSRSASWPGARARRRRWSPASNAGSNRPAWPPSSGSSVRAGSSFGSRRPERTAPLGRPGRSHRAPARLAFREHRLCVPAGGRRADRRAPVADQAAGPAARRRGGDGRRAGHDGARRGGKAGDGRRCAGPDRRRPRPGRAAGGGGRPRGGTGRRGGRSPRCPRERARPGTWSGWPTSTASGWSSLTRTGSAAESLSHEQACDTHSTYLASRSARPRSGAASGGRDRSDGRRGDRQPQDRRDRRQRQQVRRHRERRQAPEVPPRDRRGDDRAGDRDRSGLPHGAAQPRRHEVDGGDGRERELKPGVEELERIEPQHHGRATRQQVPRRRRTRREPRRRDEDSRDAGPHDRRAGARHEHVGGRHPTGARRAGAPMTPQIPSATSVNAIRSATFWPLTATTW